MTIPKRCVAYVVYQDRDWQITLPSGGAAGTTVSLGKLGLTPVVLQRASGTLQALDFARLQKCEAKREAAYAKDRPTYDECRRLELAQLKKMDQFLDIIVSQTGPNVPPTGEIAKKPEEKKPTAETKKPTPKPGAVLTKKKVQKIHKWLSAYEPKVEERVIVTGSLIPTGPSASPAPEVAAETREKKAMTAEVLKTPAKPNSYFGLPNK